MAETPLIQLKDVVKTLGVNHVLNGVNLRLQRGEITAIIGKSGSGKSVLLKHIIGLLEPDSGTIRFDGKDRSEMSPGEKKTLKRKFSYVFQDTALFDFLSVFENVSLPLVEREGISPAEVNRRVRDKLHQLDLHDIEGNYPAQLSGGMKKRVAIARSLAMNPDLILYDEPTAELDPINTDELANTILKLKENTRNTTVIVTHDLNFALYVSDRIAMISEGRIVEVGTPAEIKVSQIPIVRSFIHTTTKGIKVD